MKTIPLSLVLCLSLPALAFAENEATPAYPQHHEEASAPIAPTANGESSGTATEKLLSVQIDEKFTPGSDPVPLSDYVNGGYYTK